MKRKLIKCNFQHTKYWIETKGKSLLCDLKSESPQIDNACDEEYCLLINLQTSIKEIYNLLKSKGKVKGIG